MGMSRFFQMPLTASMIGAGILFALLPDVDYLLHLARGNSSRDAYKHRDTLHLPLVFVPVGVVLLYPFGHAWAVLFGAASFLHFVHDSIGIGWGVQWLWPFCDDHYSFLYIYRPPGRTEYLPRKWVYVWRHRDIEAWAARYGDPDWIKNIYFRPHPYAIVEFTALLIALIMLFFRTR